MKTIDENGTQAWRNEEHQHHKEDGPAYIDTVGNQIWYKNGLVHRKNGPAVIYADGSQSWYKDNIFIRKEEL